MSLDPARLHSQLVILRTSQAVTQYEIADRIGSRQNTISPWETGAQVPTIPWLVRYLAALGYHLEVVSDANPR